MHFLISSTIPEGDVVYNTQSICGNVVTIRNDEGDN